MKSQFETEVKALHQAALTISTRMIAALQPGETEVLLNAVKHGGSLLLQIEGLPDCKRVRLFMRELEGTLHPLASIGASHD